MNPLERQGRLLLQAGILIFLAALIVGLCVPLFAVPRLGLSTHLLGLMQGLFLMVAGLFWARLALAPGAARIALVLVLYGTLAAWTANLLAGIWGAGGSMLSLAAGNAKGSPLQEGLVKLALRSAAVSLIVAVAIMSWGLLRRPAAGPSENSKG